MIKKLIATFTLALFISFGLSAQRVAIVDINEILESYSDYNTAEAELSQVAKQWEQEIAQEFDKIKAMYNKYQAEQVLLSPEQKTQREEEIMRKEQEVREMQKAKFGPEGELFRMRQELVSPIQEKIYAAIEDFAADRGYDLIFDKGSNAGLLFASEEFNKTKDVKRRLGIK